MGPRPASLSLGADLEPTAIDLDDGQGWSGGDAWLELVGLELIDLLVPLVLKLLAGLVGDAVELPTAEGQLGQFAEGLGGLAKGGFTRRGANHFAVHRRAEVMAGQAKRGALREKNPGGRPGSGIRVRRR